MKRCAADIVNEMKRKTRFWVAHESGLSRDSGVNPLCIASHCRVPHPCAVPQQP